MRSALRAAEEELEPKRILFLQKLPSKIRAIADVLRILQEIPSMTRRSPDGDGNAYEIYSVQLEAIWKRQTDDR